MNLDPTTALFMMGLIVRFMMAALFVQSGLHMLRDTVTHIGVVQQYQLLPRSLVPAFAYCLPVLMLMTAIGMLIPAGAVIAAGTGAGLLILFTLAMGINLLRGRDRIDCGCGGSEGQPLSGTLLVRNLFLIALLSVATFAPTSGPTDPVLLISALGCAGTGVGFYFAANALLKNGAVIRSALR